MNECQFGDGYSQRVGDGLNARMENWDVSFTLRTKTEILGIESFLKSMNGVTAFQWLTPRGEILLFVCKKWKTSPGHDGNWSLTCTFEQVPA